jgi:hypothetical protein
MSATKKTDRIYLRDDETKVLQSLLQEWSDKSDKKSRDAFVSGTAVPKIQGLNVKDYGPDVISTSKVAKVQWEKRVTVSHFRLFFVICKHITLMLGGLHMVQESQAVQGQAGVQARKEDPTPAGCRKGEGHGDR